ncbi:BQ5605_C024g09896 [Microbotryum silenes-dioicae]|uniref:BQ5605_C024g09896 protein n=1 Tax=Microbotryum silenes-dioicae TaxID=796604 RepID=A0A2X0PFK0_9BASI|nr:BQ5605_C024g09896 [Microbotryum silenes-dioicae]
MTLTHPHQQQPAYGAPPAAGQVGGAPLPPPQGGEFAGQHHHNVDSSYDARGQHKVYSSGVAHHNNTLGHSQGLQYEMAHHPSNEGPVEKLKHHFSGEQSQNPNNGGGFGAGYTGTDHGHSNIHPQPHGHGHGNSGVNESARVASGAHVGQAGVGAGTTDTGSHHHTGSHHDQTAHKPSVGEKISGSADVLIGKLTQNDAKIAQGEAKKTFGKDALAEDRSRNTMA